MGSNTVPGGLPFVGGTYDRRPGERIVDLILRQGDIAANRAARSGEIWGNAIAQAGHDIGQGVQQWQQHKDQQQVGGAVSAALSPQYPSATKPVAGTGTGVPDSGANHIQAILDSVDPALRPHVLKGIQDFNAAADVADERRARIAKLQQDAQQADADAVGVLAHHIIKNKFLDGPDGGLGAMQTAVTIAKQRGIPNAHALDQQIQQFGEAMAQAQQRGDPGAVEAVAAQGRKIFGPILQQFDMGMSESARDRIRKNEAPIPLKEGEKLLDPTSLATLADNPKADAWQLKETDKGLQPWNPKDPMAMGPVVAKNKPPASMIVNPAQTDRAKLIADAIESGEQPPDTKGLYRDGPAVKAELAKRHFNLATAELDWKATQKHIASMNGPTQLKLNQSINALPELLDSVDALASQWKGGRFPLLNKANLAAAKAGAYGSEVAAVAVKLDAQIADVTADLGNVYMGGNSPTDHSLSLAAKSLSGDWDEKVLHSMVDLARSNVQIRQNSIKHSGVMGASAGNMYGTPEPAAPAAVVPPKPTHRFNPATGKIEAVQ